MAVFLVLQRFRRRGVPRRRTLCRSGAPEGRRSRDETRTEGQRDTPSTADHRRENPAEVARSPRPTSRCRATACGRRGERGVSGSSPREEGIVVMVPLTTCRRHIGRSGRDPIRGLAREPPLSARTLRSLKQTARMSLFTRGCHRRQRETGGFDAHVLSRARVRNATAATVHRGTRMLTSRPAARPLLGPRRRLRLHSATNTTTQHHRRPRQALPRRPPRPPRRQRPRPPPPRGPPRDSVLPIRVQRLQAERRLGRCRGLAHHAEGRLSRNSCPRSRRSSPRHPPAIKGDFQTVFTYFNKFYSDLASINFDFTKLTPAMEKDFTADSAGVSSARRPSRPTSPRLAGWQRRRPNTLGHRPGDPATPQLLSPTQSGIQYRSGAESKPSQAGGGKGNRPDRSRPDRPLSILTR